MIIKKIKEGQVPTGTKKDVPVVFHEPHVETGFRLVHQPWTYYIYSLFQRHNECMNVWTHLIGLLVVIGKFYNFPFEYNLKDPYIYPFLASALSMTLMYICSISAHCFHNKSEQWHFTCFFIDYMGIGIYGLGSAIAHYYYCADLTMKDTFIHNNHVLVAVCLSVILTFCCCYSKVKYKRPYPFARKIWQVSAVFATYSWLIFPIVHWICTSSWRGQWLPSFDHHVLQGNWFIAAGFFFGSDIPQRFFPGKFDFLGHSHQIFHICIMFMSVKQLDAMYIDMQLRKDEIKIIMNDPTFLGSVGTVLLAVLINLSVIYIFHNIAKRKIAAESQQKGK